MTYRDRSAGLCLSEPFISFRMNLFVTDAYFYTTNEHWMSFDAQFDFFLVCEHKYEYFLFDSRPSVSHNLALSMNIPWLCTDVSRLLNRVLLFVCSTCLPGGLWSCNQNPQCVGRCVMSGDPHYSTFDGVHFSFVGQCEYVLVQPARGVTLPNPFSITVENKFCASSSDAICPKALTFQLGTGQDAIAIR